MSRVASCLLLAVAHLCAAPASASRRVEVHLFGGDMTEGAPLAPWYRQIGITDVWLYPFRGAFPQDQLPETQLTSDDLRRTGALRAYRQSGLRIWWFERPVPDVLYTRAKREDSHLWDDSPATDAVWDEVCRNVTAIYPGARRGGFAGLVYDNEAYYSYQGDEGGKTKPGAGLGLYICRGLVEAHGGTIRADRAPGGGAEMSFTIPRATKNDGAMVDGFEGDGHVEGVVTKLDVPLPVEDLPPAAVR